MDIQIAPERFQTANRVLMIRPKLFGFHAQASQSNAFMNEPSRDSIEVAHKAEMEFDALAQALTGAGVEVLIHQDVQGLPDCVFPNNWVSCHQPLNGAPVLITYPMCDQLRRMERSELVLERLGSVLGEVDHIDFADLEDDEEILEGTGSLVLDRVAGIAFACCSPRTTIRAFEAWCDETGYEPVAFEALDTDDQPIYHTNVMMSVGEHFSVVCAQTIRDAQDRAHVLERLQADGRPVIEISSDQMNNFCGNILELRTIHGKPVIAMSSRAWQSFSVKQQSILKDIGKVIHIPIPTIENVGGGSVRCMIAECGRV